MVDSNLLSKCSRAVVAVVVAILFCGCSGVVDEPALVESEPMTGLVENADEFVSDVEQESRSSESADDESVEGDEGIPDIMAGERQLFLNAQRVYEERMEREKAEKDAEQR